MNKIQLVLALLAVLAVSTLGFRLYVAEERFDLPADHRPTHASQVIEEEAVHIVPSKLAKAQDLAALVDELKNKTKVTFDEAVLTNEAVKKIDLGYAGFVTVNESANSNMFYWFFEAQNGDKDAPIILWLQGGPGASSLFGLFGEMGPIQVSDKGEILPRVATWNRNYSLIFIDNPVGVGFSFTDDQSSLSTTEEQVAANLYTTLSTFFTVHSEYADNDFYIFGESYAGKYVPALGHYVYRKNKDLLKGIHMPHLGSTVAKRINLVGLGIGDGLSDPLTQSQGYADIAFNIGFADENQKAVMEKYQRLIVQNILTENWAQATADFGNLVNGPPDYFQNITASDNYFDVRLTFSPDQGGDFVSFINRPDIRAKLNVGNHLFHSGAAAGNALNDDICKSVKHTFRDLFENYKVLFYNGQWDYIVAGPLTERMLYTVEWPGLEGYKRSKRTIWKVRPSLGLSWKDEPVKPFPDPEDGDVAGYVRNYKNLWQVIVRGAGHMVPYNQLIRSYDMVDRFINNIPFDDSQ